MAIGACVPRSVTDTVLDPQAATPNGRGIGDCSNPYHDCYRIVEAHIE